MAMRNLLDNSLVDERNNLFNHSNMAEPNLFDELVDQYKLQKHLAQSGVTDIYLAYDVDENREVVIEILLPFLAQNRTYADRFATKMRQVAQIKHRHISHVLQVGLAPFNNRPYFARERIEYYPLSTRIQQLKKQDTPVNSVYALKLVRQLAEALSLAEKLELFHYDLQPDKVWLEPNGNVILADLGIPRLKNFSNNGSLAQQNPNYWSPEQVQGKSINAKSHVYSLGVILFELLTGTLPVIYDSVWQTIKQSANQKSLAVLRQDLSGETYRLVNRAIRAQQWSRFSDSKEFIAAVDEAIKAEEFSIGTRTALPRRSTSNLWLKIAAPILVLVVIAGIVLLALQGGRGNNTAVSDATLTAAAVVDLAAEPTGTFTPTPTVTDTPILETITVFAPAPEQTFKENESINFVWTWPIPLAEDEQFVVEGFAADRELFIGQVTESPDNFNYNLTVPAATFSLGTFEWQVTLMSTSLGTAVTQSDKQTINIIAAPTNTPEPTATPSLTPEPSSMPSSTPLPQVQVNVSSASLRVGPGTHYDVIRYLEQGEVVTVIAISRADGDWYNVLTGNGTLGWVAISTVVLVGETAVNAVPTAATIPPSPTPTNTATPTSTPIPTPTPPPGSGGGNSGGGNTGGGSARPTRTPPPPP